MEILIEQARNLLKTRSYREAAKAVGLELGAFRSLIEGKDCKLSTVTTASKALGLDFNIDAPKNTAQQTAHQPPANEIAEIVESRLEELSLTPIKAANKYGLQRDAFRGILRGHEPTYSRLKHICQALDLDFHIGAPNNAAQHAAHQSPADEIAEIVESRLEELSLTPIKAANKYGLPRDAIRGVLRGREPTYSRLKQICQALGLEFHIGAPKNNAQHAADHSATDAAQNLSRHIPVIGMAACGKDGWASLGMNDFKATMPDRGMSDLSFAVIASGDSMQPYGIYPGAVCYCDPKVKPELGHFLFIEKRIGRGKNRKQAMTIKRLEEIDTNGDIFVSGFQPMHHDEDDDPRETDMPYGMQFRYTEAIQRHEIIRTAVVCWININPVL